MNGGQTRLYRQLGHANVHPMTRADVTYLAVADQLEPHILRLPAGTRLPSENELASTHEVSRLTARSALQELEQRQLVRRTRGSGTFVALRLEYPIRSGERPSWSQTVTALGHRCDYETIELGTIRAPAVVARHLAIPRGRTVTQLVRRGLVDGEVATLQTQWFPVDLVPDLSGYLGDGGSVALALHDAYRIEVERWWSRAELVSAPADVAPLLELVGRPPAWHVESVNLAIEHGRPVEYSISWMRADCFRVVLEHGPVPDANQRSNPASVAHLASPLHSLEHTS